MIGDKRVAIPKLTVAKWKALFAAIETLPAIIVTVLSAKGRGDFTATLITGAGMALDEVVKIIAVLTDLDAEWIEANADHNDILTFITKTAKKNDLNDAIKKFQSVLARSKSVATAGVADTDVQN